MAACGGRATAGGHAAEIRPSLKNLRNVKLLSLFCAVLTHFCAICYSVVHFEVVLQNGVSSDYFLYAGYSVYAGGIFVQAYYR
jgi:hypothetical protein